MKINRFVSSLILLLFVVSFGVAPHASAAQRRRVGKSMTARATAAKSANAGKTDAAKPPAGATTTAQSGAAPATDVSAEGSTTNSSTQSTAAQSAAAKSVAAKTNKKVETTKKKSDARPSAERALSEEELKARLDAAVALQPAERVEELRKFINAYPNSSLKKRAQELLTSARAALGDEKLRTGDAEAGIQLFQLAVEEAPAETSDKLFVEVLSQLPANLFLRNQREAAFALARRLEKGIASDPKRLVALASFYLGVEQADEAARLAEAASQLAPDLAAAHLMHGNAQRVALRLDRAEASFRRALELDAKSVAAMRGLADMARASGRASEALNLYRQILTANPQDASAQSGAVLSLFESGRREEAEREMETVLKGESRNLPLLVGAAWWYLSQGEAPRALELATSAVRLEPRYTWAHIVLARALVAQKRPLEAEQSLRFARQYGRFPTLDYELANALVAAGLYEEAAEELSRSFTLREGQIETRLAGRVPARAADFVELLAPERRASIAQSSAFDTPAGARMLKGLLALHLATSQTTKPSTPDASVTAGASPTGAALREAAGDFVGEATDPMRVFRRLYAAARLARHATAFSDASTQAAAWQPVLEAADAAMSGLDAALDAPVATLAVMADELREYRARALSAGSVTSPPDVPRNVLSNVVRGRIEDLAGWALFNQGKTAEAVVRLRRAASVLPLESPWWRTANWHLGIALEASGNQTDALNAYLRSYNPQSPDPVRRAIIERLYQRVNGSLEGLEAKLGRSTLARSIAPITNTNTSAPPMTTDAPASALSTTPAASNVGALPAAVAAPAQPATPQPTREPDTPQPEKTQPEKAVPEKSVPEKTVPERVAEASPTPVTPAPVAPDAPQTTAAASPPPDAAAVATPTPEATPAASATPAATTPAQTGDRAAPTPAPTATATPPEADASASKQRVSARHTVTGKVDCEMRISQTALEINRSASTLVSVTLDRLDDASAIKVSTPDWAHIIILAEPRAAGDAGNTARYRISSVGKSAGAFTVLFSSPCGTQEVKVSVK